jgi:hypothetical protein
MTYKKVYVVPIKIGERNTQRVISPTATSSRILWPHANVGDTLVIPIHLDRYLSSHTFAKVDAKDWPVALYFGSPWQPQEFIMKQASAEPVVRNDAGDWVKFIASSHSAGPDHAGDNFIHDLTTYLEFKKAGEISLDGRLADADEKMNRVGTSFRVLPKNEPVTVVIGHSNYTGFHTKGSAGWEDRVPLGTLQARVGDFLIMDCGSYKTSVHESPAQVRMGVVTVREFKNVEPFVPEMKK